jgi:PAS domain S-box-containing protein
VSIDRHIELNPVTIAPNILVKDAVALIAQKQAENKSSCLLIVAEQQLVGILTQTDLIRLVATETDLGATTVGMVMTQPVLTMIRSQAQNLTFVWSFLKQHGISYLPIVQNDGELVGIINARSLMSYFNLTAKRDVNQETANDHQTPHSPEPSFSNQNEDFSDRFLMQSLMGETPKTALHRQKTVMQLRQERDFSEAVINTVGALITVLDRQGAIVSFNRTCEQVTGYSFAEVKGQQIWDFLISAQEINAVKAVFERLLEGQFHSQYENYWIGKDGSQHLISWSNRALLDDRGKIEFIIATGIDVTEQRRVWDKLELQYRQTKLLTETTRRIRMSIDLKEILQTTVTEIQHLLACDRVLIMEIKSNQNTLPISEALIGDLPSMLGYEFADPLLMGEYLTRHPQEQVLAIDNLDTAAIDPDIKQLLKQFQVQAKLVVPILSQGKLQGLLVAHQCHHPRQWQKSEIQLLHQLADQIGVALSQAQLLNYAEELAEERTKELTATNELLKLEIAERTQTEQDLRENQQKLAGILDNADEAIISVDERQQIQLFNQGAEKIFGYQASEIIGQSLDLLLPQVFRQIHRHHVLEFGRLPAKSRKMAERNSNVYGRHQDGHEFPAEASVAKLQTKAGMLFTVMLKDISERQHTQEKLQTSKALLAKAEKIAKIGSWEYDHETQQKSWSEELFNILEFDQDLPSLPGCAEILARVHPEDLLLVKKTLRAGHQQGESWELNYRLQFPNGKIKYIESRGEPTVNSEGRVLRVLETIMDVSDRIQSAKSLERSEAQLKLITDALPVFIAYIDHHQRYLYNNRTYESWYGRPRSSLRGKTIREVVGESNYQQMLPYIETVLGGKAVTFESQPVTENGNSYWINATYIPDFSSSGEVKGFFSMAEDITERKAIEQMKSEFISIASHEMRTPLTAIHGVIKLLSAGRLGELSESGAKMVEMALRNGDRLVRLVNDILDLERMESGRDEINRQPCDSGELIRQTIDSLSSMAQAQGIQLTTVSPSIELLADRDRIVQTLSNLISNAIKFSPANSTVWISAEWEQQNVLFTVKDSGRGIPTEQLETIFERFKQVDASDSRQKGGTGLGLAICRHIVEQHQGKIWAESIEGQGSIFFFTLPQT